MTNWSKPSLTTTGWSKVQTPQTTYDNKYLEEYTGCLMDDSVYTMDSTKVNTSDIQLNPIYAPGTDWT